MDHRLTVSLSLIDSHVVEPVGLFQSGHDVFWSARLEEEERLVRTGQLINPCACCGRNNKQLLF